LSDRITCLWTALNQDGDAGGTPKPKFGAAFADRADGLAICRTRGRMRAWASPFDAAAFLLCSQWPS